MINLAALAPSRIPTLPHRIQIKERLLELSEETHTQLLSKLPDSGRMSIAVDCWTSPDQKAFLALTGYFLTEDMDYHEVLLGFRPVAGSHTGENLAEIVLEVLQKHHLTHRLLGVTTDNASNNSTMFSAIASELRAQLSQGTYLHNAIVDSDLAKIIRSQHHIPCLAHVIQLSVNAFLRKLRIEAANEAVEYTGRIMTRSWRPLPVSPGQLKRYVIRVICGRLLQTTPTAYLMSLVYSSDS